MIELTPACVNGCDCLACQNMRLRAALEAATARADRAIETAIAFQKQITHLTARVERAEAELKQMARIASVFLDGVNDEEWEKTDAYQAALADFRRLDGWQKGR